MNKGFTLIELLVVVLIIGILSATALPQYTRTVEKSRAAEINIWISNAKKAFDLYYLANGFPSSTVHLTGPNAEGDIDLSLGNVREGITETWNKSFTASATCNSTECYLDVYRNQTNPDIAGNIYRLSARYNPSSGAWVSRRMTVSQPSAKSVAQAFKQEGWTITESY